MKNSPIIHHVSVINRDIQQSFQFYHRLLGLDLLFKSVNQDDVEMYHLFFSDTTGRPGTEFTVFQMSSGVDRTFGTNAIERTVFTVPSEESLSFWEKRLNEYGLFNCEIEAYNDSKILRFEDHDGVQLGLVPLKESAPKEDYFPRETSDIPVDHAIIGIDAVHLRVRYPEATVTLLQNLFDVPNAKQILHNDLPTTVLSKEGSFLHQEIHVIEDKKNPREIEGIGSTHHVALSVKNEAALNEVNEKVLERNFLNSGVKDREFFSSIYFREANDLLIEVATEEGEIPEKTLDTYEGIDFGDVPLILPDFLEPQRNFIERRLYP